MTKIQSLRLLAVAALTLAVPVASQAGIFFSVNIGPPPLPVYEQPFCPGPGYIWTPGYWAYGDEGYFWVPGTWVLAPFTGGLWTPGYWGWGGSAFLWHAGYWGTSVGFYGGVNYGYGYGGIGYEGGYWNHGAFFYNRSVSRVNVVNIHNVYNRTVINNYGNSRVSYNGGAGGLNYRANAAQMSAYNSRRSEATSMQLQHRQAASQNRAMFASVNHGAPGIAATQRPGAFSGPGVVRATQAGGAYHPAAGRPVGGAAPSRWSQSQSQRPPNAGNRPTMTQRAPAQQYRAPAQRYNAPAHNSAPAQHYNAPAQHYNAPQRNSAPAQHYNAPAQHYNAPQHNSAPAQHYNAPQRSAPSRPAQHAESAPRPAHEQRH